MKKDKIKENGQVYTPEHIVLKILDEVGFKGDIAGKTILEPSSGDGSFLLEIAKRIIACSNKKNIVENLLCLHGWEIDQDAVNQSIDKLNCLIRPLKIKVPWNVLRRDSLFYDETQKFDFVVGNPPYVRIHNLTDETRNKLRTDFMFCKKGMIDLYYAFFEIAIKLLKKEGSCGYITPNSFFYNQSAQSLRDFLIQNRFLRKVINYGDMKVFPDNGTYCAITLFKNSACDHFSYCKVENFDEKKQIIHFSDIELGKTWNFFSPGNTHQGGVPLKELCEIHCGLATLCDSVFIFPIKDSKDENVVIAMTKNGEYEIEKNILKPIIKASTLKSQDQPIEKYILFPYHKIGEKWVDYEEDVLKKCFPKAYLYLELNKKRLMARDKGIPKANRWYSFGRTQGLSSSFGKKILFSPMNLKPNFIFSDKENATFYSGYCIKFGGSYEKLLTQLNSEKMEEFIHNSQRDFQNGWKSYTKKGIENFTIDLNQLYS